MSSRMEYYNNTPNLLYHIFFRNEEEYHSWVMYTRQSKTTRTSSSKFISLRLPYKSGINNSWFILIPKVRMILYKGLEGLLGSLNTKITTKCLLFRPGVFVMCRGTYLVSVIWMCHLWTLLVPYLITKTFFETRFLRSRLRSDDGQKHLFKIVVCRCG